MPPLELPPVLDVAMDAVISADAMGRVRGWNAAAEAMFGYTSTEILGRELAATIIPAHLRDAHRTGLHRFAHSGTGRLDGRTETEGQRRDGTLFPIELTITRVVRDGDVTFVGFLRDLTERDRMLADLQESRRRLVAVSDENRRRLERDLHDGAQQHLVALAIALGQTREQLDVDTDSARITLDRSVEILAHAIEELRDLARGVHAGVLTDRGLSPALTQLARRSPLDVTVSVDLPRRLPAVVETSVYYLSAEALTNAAKYGARSVDVALSEQTTSTRPGPERIVGSIADDGPGGADPARGTGLAGMRERLEALGGSLSISSPSGAGTTLHFAVPAGRTTPASPHHGRSCHDFGPGSTRHQRDRRGFPTDRGGDSGPQSETNRAQEMRRLAASHCRAAPTRRL